MRGLGPSGRVCKVREELKIDASDSLRTGEEKTEKLLRAIVVDRVLLALLSRVGHKMFRS